MRFKFPLKTFISFLGIIFCFLALPFPVWSQQPTAPADARPSALSLSDTVTAQINGSLPFDQPFSLKYSVHGKIEIYSADLFEIDKNGCLMNSCLSCPAINKDSLTKYKKIKDSLTQLGQRLKDTLRKTSSANITRKKQLDTVIDANKKQILATETKIKKIRSPVISLRLNVLTRSPNGDVTFLVPALEPNKRFIIFVSAFINPEGIKQIIKTLAVNFYDTFTVRNIYTDIVNKYSKSYPNPYGLGSCSITDFGIDPHISHFYALLDSNFKHKIDTLKSQQNILDSITKNYIIDKNSKFCKPTIYNPGPAFLASIDEYSRQCLRCKDSMWQYQWAVPNKFDLAHVLSSLTDLNDISVYTGLRTLTGLYQTPTTTKSKDFDWPKAADNLLTTYKLVQNLIELTQYLLISNPSLHDSGVALIKQLTTARECLSTNYDSAKIFAKTMHIADSSLQVTMASLVQTLSHYAGFSLPVTELSSDSYTFDFQTRAGFSLQADVGFLCYRIPPDPHVQYGFAPYLGFHFNFRPLNTDVPYRLIPHKGLWGHLSFNAGVLLTSVEEEGKRTGLIGTASIFTGLGYGISHAIRFNAGAVWYRKEDPNPLISNTTTAAMPYLGISIDLRLRVVTSTFKQWFNL